MALTPETQKNMRLRENIMRLRENNEVKPMVTQEEVLDDQVIHRVGVDEHN